MRLVMGEDFINAWAQEPPGDQREAVRRFLNRDSLTTWFWRRTGEDPSVSLWLAEGPPRRGLNATTQLTTVCLHHHLDMVTSIDNSELAYAMSWIDRPVGGMHRRGLGIPPILRGRPPTISEGAA